MKPTYGLAIACLFTAATACSKATPDALAEGPTAPATASAAAPAQDKAAATAAVTAATPPAAAPAAAAPDVTYRWETHKATNLKFELPTTWTMTPKGNVLVAQTPTPGVAIEFVAATGGVEAKNDEKVMLGAVAKTLKGAKLTSKMKPAHQHGLTGFVATGTGTKDGNEVEWFTSAIGDGKGHALLTLGMYRPTASAAYRAQMVRVLDSIQPAK
jgi:hypothetical protein